MLMYHILKVDKYFAVFFNEHCIFKQFFEKITILGRAEIYLVIALIFTVYSIYSNKEQIKNKAVVLFFSIVFSGIFVIILKFTFARYRPKLFIEKHLFGFSWFDIGYDVSSFPSGHTAIAFAAMVSLGYIFPKFKYIFLLLAILVGVSRVVLDAHYISDVLVGAFLGFLISYSINRKFILRNISK